MALTVSTTYPEPGIVSATWTALANGNVGDKINISRWADKTVQVFGTVGVGGSISIEGSNDGTNWRVLTDPQGNALTVTTASAIELIAENPLHIRPNVTAGDGTTSFSVIIIGRQGY